MIQIRKLCLILSVASVAMMIAMVYQEFGPINEDQLAHESVRRADLVADFFYPKDINHAPLIVALGGSSGGFLPQKELQALALEGYAVLALAYFNIDPLPNKLENIPLEYFDSAIAWAQKHSVIDSSRTILLGVSRGAELALLLASRSPEIKGVIAYAPGCFVLPNAVDADGTAPIQSSWSYKGRGLPFAPLEMLRGDLEDVIDYDQYVLPLLSGANRDSYTIPVEKGNADLLLISGEDDRTWPAAEMANLVEQRLENNNYPYVVRNVVYPGAGHALFQMQDNYQIFESAFFRSIYLTVNGKKHQFNQGGSVWRNILAKRKARREALAFLRQFK